MTEKTTPKLYLIICITVLIVIAQLMAIYFITDFLIKDNEYSKVWGKENFEIIQKLQMVQIQQAVDYYKKNPDAINWWVQQPPQGQEPQAKKTESLSEEIIAWVKKDYPFQGKTDAKVSIIEYSDLECPYCKKLYETDAIKNIVWANPDSINYTFKHFPLNFHQNAPKQHEALECARELWWDEKYFSMISEIFTRTTSNGNWFSLSKLAPLAKELGMDETKFQTCLDEWKYTQKVNDAMTEWKALFEINGTPGIVVINNETGTYEVISWAQPESVIEATYKRVSQK